jgi:hypothetical protein
MCPSTTTGAARAKFWYIVPNYTSQRAARRLLTTTRRLPLTTQSSTNSDWLSSTHPTLDHRDLELHQSPKDRHLVNLTEQIRRNRWFECVVAPSRFAPLVANEHTDHNPSSSTSLRAYNPRCISPHSAPRTRTPTSRPPPRPRSDQSPDAPKQHEVLYAPGYPSNLSNVPS